MATSGANVGELIDGKSQRNCNEERYEIPGSSAVLEITFLVTSEEEKRRNRWKEKGRVQGLEGGERRAFRSGAAARQETHRWDARIMRGRPSRPASRLAARLALLGRVIRRRTRMLKCPAPDGDKAFHTGHDWLWHEITVMMAA